MDDAELRDALAMLHADSFRWALACCGRDVSLAETTMQSSYLKVLERRASFQGRSTFKTWLFGLIRGTAREERRRAFIRRVLMPWDVAPRTPEEERSSSEARELVLGALRRLPRRQREVVELVFYHDFTLDQAAAVLAISPGSARVHYARAKQRLRCLLETIGEPNERRQPAAKPV